MKKSNKATVLIIMNVVLAVCLIAVLVCVYNAEDDKLWRCDNCNRLIDGLYYFGTSEKRHCASCGPLVTIGGSGLSNYYDQSYTGVIFACGSVLCLGAGLILLSNGLVLKSYQKKEKDQQEQRVQ